MNKWFKRTVSMVFAAGVLLGTAGLHSTNVQAASVRFTDVKSTHWAASSIAAGVEKGYVTGYTNGTFKPDASITRSEFLKMAVSALDLEVGSASGKWYTPYVTAANEEGLYKTTDFANSEAEWNKTISRQEMARIAARAAGETTTENDKWMYLATKKGLITGVGKGEIAENGLSSRAQAVVVIERILTANDGGKLPVDKYAVGSAEVAWHGTNVFTVMPSIFKNPEDWNEKNMTIDSKDGMYRGQMEAFVAIDLNDKNDPNLSLLGDLTDYYWFNNDPSRKLPLAAQRNSYVLFITGGTIFNKKPDAYNGVAPLNVSIHGMYAVNSSDFYEKGILNAPAQLYKKRFGDTAAYVVPKKGWKFGGDLQVVLNTPARSNYGWKENVIYSDDHQK